MHYNTYRGSSVKEVSLLPNKLPKGQMLFLETTGEIYVGTGDGLRKASDKELKDLVAEHTKSLQKKRDTDTKITRADLDTSHDTRKIGLNNLADEVRSAMTGNTPVSPNIGNESITYEKYAKESVGWDTIQKPSLDLFGDYKGRVYRKDFVPSAEPRKYYKKGDYYDIDVVGGTLAIFDNTEGLKVGEKAKAVFDGTKWNKVSDNRDHPIFTNPQPKIRNTSVGNPFTTFIYFEYYDRSWIATHPDDELVMGVISKSADGSGKINFYWKTLHLNAEVGSTLQMYDDVFVPEGAEGICDLKSSRNKARLVFDWDAIPVGTEHNIYNEFGYTVKPQCSVLPSTIPSTLQLIKDNKDSGEINKSNIEAVRSSVEDVNYKLDFIGDTSINILDDYSLVPKLTGVNYTSSTFSGWASYVGRPTQFNNILLPIISRGNITIVHVYVYLNNYEPTTDFVHKVILEVNIPDGKMEELSIQLPHTVTLDGNTDVYVKYLCNDLCSMPYSRRTDTTTTLPNRHFTNGTLNNTIGLTGGGYDIYCRFRLTAPSLEYKPEPFNVSCDRWMKTDTSLITQAIEYRTTPVYSNSTGDTPVTMYDSSTFTGWGSYVRKPQKFNSITFQVKNREESRVLDQVGIKVYKNNIGGDLLYEGVHPFSNISPDGIYHDVTIDLNYEVINTDNSFIYITLSFGRLITLKWVTHPEGNLDGDFPKVQYTTNQSVHANYVNASVNNYIPYLTFNYNKQDLYPTKSFMDKFPNSSIDNVVSAIQNEGYFLPENLPFNNTFEKVSLDVVAHEHNTLKKPYYLTSTFSGWGSAIPNSPNVKKIEAIKFSIECRDTPITSVKVFLTRKDKRGEVLASAILPVEGAKPKAIIEVIWRLETPLSNTKGEWLYFTYNANQLSNVIAQSYTNTTGTHFGVMTYTTDGNMLSSPSTMADVAGGSTELVVATQLIEAKEVYRISEIALPTNTSTKPEVNTNAVRVILPDKYQAVVGDTIQLFYRGIVEAVDPYIYDIRITCGRGKSFPRYWEYKPEPSEVGSYAFKVEVYDNAKNLMASDQCILEVKDVKSPSAPVNILCVGDSLTAGGAWVTEACRRFTQTGGSPVANNLSNINFIGTKTGSHGAKWEGYGGWTWHSYLAKPNETTLDVLFYGSHDKTADDQHSVWIDGNGNKWSLETLYSDKLKFTRFEGHTGKPPLTGTLTHVSNAVHTTPITYTSYQYADGNPFWDTATNKVNFKAYCDRHGFSGIDYVYTLLTWNGGPCDKAEISDNAWVTEGAKTFIDLLHESYPNAKVKIMGVQLPSLNGGCGSNYGAGGGYSHTYGLVRGVFGMNLTYQSIANESKYSSFVEYVNVSGQFDSEHNMPVTQKAVNTRSTVKETFGTNGVHPATEGYYQIADVCYRNFLNRIQ